MKKVVHYLLVTLLSIGVFSCADEYDDSFLKEEIENIKKDLASLKTQVTSIQTLVDALNKGKVITNIEKSDKGHKITFNDGASIEVLNGEKAPVIGVQESESVYYWTITTDGKTDFLLDKEGKKLPVSGKEGIDGDPGKTPQMAIDADGYWTVDGIRIKDANGDLVEAKGDSFFKEVKEDDNTVTFVLADGSTIIIPKSEGTFIAFEKTIVIFNPGQTQQLRFNYANVQSLEIISQPAGWATNIHQPQKYVNVVAPANGYGLGEIKLQGIDKNGLTYVTIVKVGIAGKGYSATGGIFILNEGNMTTENASLIYITPDEQVLENVYKAANGTQLGNVGQDLFIHNNKIYIITQNGKTNPLGSVFENDGMLVVANAETLKKEAAYTDELSNLSWPSHIAVLDETNIFIRDNAGIYRFNSVTKELQLISGTKGAIKNRMAVADGKVFFYVGKNLSVIEKGADAVSYSIEMSGTIRGIEKSKDGHLWVATSDKKISKVNSVDYSIIKTNDLTVGNVGNSFFATPGITSKGDTLYYGTGNMAIYRHIFSTGESKEMINAVTVKSLVPDAGMEYNGIGVHPETGKVYMNTIKGYGWDFTISNISIFDFDDEDAESVLYDNYRNHTRFPAGFFFPANFK
ncbi:DUF5074 domain-containing protein [Proteiniphilum sp.]|uniref:DUF5074 domain-containing protein n=1 Tax=Proteiniphilum sp. TaxID=1926877 RepID=UPI002B20DAD8|nr:DUF5074 domain-containing protein [Proteiniphilum sp.]MEA4918299.1 PL29 family lyase N-terminal domain-containing protein [Proteiniphilum sp.]